MLRLLYWKANYTEHLPWHLYSSLPAGTKRSAAIQANEVCLFPEPAVSEWALYVMRQIICSSQRYYSHKSLQPKQLYNALIKRRRRLLVLLATVPEQRRTSTISWVTQNSWSWSFSVDRGGMHLYEGGGHTSKLMFYFTFPFLAIQNIPSD